MAIHSAKFGLRATCAWWRPDLTRESVSTRSSPRLAKPGSNVLLGSGAPSQESPLLIKVLFAKEKLSVQVHPDDKMAQKYGEPRGKTECWYALAAERRLRWLWG